MKPHDVRVRDLAKDGDLLQEAVFDLAAKFPLIDLFHGHLSAVPAMAAPPDDGEGAGPHLLRAHHVVSHHAAPHLLHLR